MLLLLLLKMVAWNRSSDVNGDREDSGSTSHPPLALPRPDDNGTDGFLSLSLKLGVPVWVVSSAVCWVAIGFELTRCLDLLLILCLSDDLDTDSRLGSDQVITG